MKSGNLRSMSVDELWKLHETVETELSRKMLAERAMLRSAFASLVAISVMAGRSAQGALTRKCFQSIAIRKIVGKHGRVAAGSRAG